MKLELSNAARLARGEMLSTRAGRDAKRAEADDLARRYRDGETVSIQEVHAAEARAQEADNRYGQARVRFAEKRAEFAPKFRERQSDITSELAAGLGQVADMLDETIKPAREVEAFATAHALPTTTLVGRANHLARVAQQLREYSHQ